MREDLHPDLLAAIEKVTAKRPRTVIDHILEHGQVTTEELRDIYGYNHPPRAARDVREAGIPLVTVRVRGSDGRKIAAYRFGDPTEIEKHKLRGRKTFSRAFKKELIEMADGRCDICGTAYQSRYLQIDHCVPYEVAGDDVGGEDSPGEFQLLCRSCQRSKSWSCEHCDNWAGTKDQEVCETCYWASPDEYRHIAGKPERRLSLTFSGEEETQDYECLATAARRRQARLAGFVKGLLHKIVSKLLE
ncbi:MAG: HNH endonuclease signature motif containing protein [Candidatus Brocadiia bacterium]